MLVTKEESEYKTELVPTKELPALYILLGQAMFETKTVRTARMETQDGKVVKTMTVGYQDERLLDELF